MFSDKIDFLASRGYRYVRSVVHWCFIGVFYVNDSPVPDELVVIKETGIAHTEYNNGIYLNKMFPTAPIVKTIASISDGRAVFLVTQYIEGITLKQLLTSKLDPILMSRFVAMLRQVADLLATTGLHHGDLHTGNIITNDDLETFTLIDLGRSEVYKNPQRRGHAVWEDIFQLLGPFYPHHSIMPPGMWEIVQNLHMQVHLSGHTTLNLHEDVTSAHKLISLFERDTMK
jgi:serine/threonine protein kinase